ncbi:MAG: hypothetical protein P4L71_22380 [Acetobacteraceae bacterium]|nr:hypothetical protein [Acetobacteraceae bacterium]
MQSANNTFIGPDQSITDAQGNVWTITAGGQVAVNGVVDPTTANVTHLAYANGLVWQENTQDLWWSKTSPAAPWSPPYGTPTIPVPPETVSLNDTVIGVSTNPPSPAPSITDKNGNTWTIVNGQVAVNGTIDPTTANVIELAYVNGKLWQENTQGLWWSKSAPADAWYPPYGTSKNPVTGSFHPGNVAGNFAIINVGWLTVSPGGGVAVQPQSTSEIVTPGVRADGTTITMITETAKLVVDGSSRLSNGATLDLIGAYRTPFPVQGPLENNGVMTVDDSTLEVSVLSGTGTIKAFNGSTLDIQSSGGGNTIQLHSSNLFIGEQAFGPGGMTFLAPITMDRASTITLNETPATSEVVKHAGASISEVFLYNGTTEVADLKVSGVAHLYASESGSGASAMTILSTTHTSNSLPIVSHVG